MKTIIFSIAILCATATSAQLTIKGGVGQSFTYHSRVVEVELGGHIKGFGISAGAIAPTNMQDGQYTAFTLTGSVLKNVTDKGYVNLGLGYAYMLSNTSTEKGRYSTMIGKFTYAHTIDEGYMGAHWYVSVATTGDTHSLTIGLMGIFSK